MLYTKLIVTNVTKHSDKIKAAYKQDLTQHKQALITSEITKHIQIRRHNFNNEDLDIFEQKKQLSARLSLEMIAIRKEPKTLNEKRDIQNLSIIYNIII